MAEPLFPDDTMIPIFLTHVILFQDLMNFKVLRSIYRILVANVIVMAYSLVVSTRIPFWIHEFSQLNFLTVTKSMLLIIPLLNTFILKSTKKVINIDYLSLSSIIERIIVPFKKQISIVQIILQYKLRKRQQPEIEWKDGTTSWLPLKEVKETNSVEVANYAVDNQIDTEPAFDWWVRDLLKRQTRLIKLSQTRSLRPGYKFGIPLPHTVEEALTLDTQNKNTLWYDAIMKEMHNVRIAFDFQDKGSVAPPGYKLIPLHMVFDIKMDLTQKARLVAGGHVTDPPSSLTYSSVVSRESVRIAFLVAALNDLNVCMADIGNAYLNAKTEEKVYAIASKEFGDDEGRTLIITRALYGLKSSGAAWRSHFADSLRDLSFLPNYADPDVWRRPAVK
jgi:hypothetical protein